jgi:hypothetical protein
MLINWLPKKPENIEILLNSNIHGDTSEAFHRLCDGKGPTYGIIETTDGYKFGGYTTKNWSKDNGPIRDDNAFVFSLDTKRKYNVQIPKNAIGGGNFCLFFGWSNNSIVTYNNCCHSNGNYISSGAYNFDDKKENGGKQYFIIKSYEVYSIK